MTLARSSLSQVCRAIADFVSLGLDAGANSIQVMIGPPASAVPGTTDSNHRINLFFYRLEPSGFHPGDSPGEPWWIRLFCLITGFGVEEEQTSAGENDLRLLGEVMRLFHEQPVLPPLTVDDETFRLQLIFQPLGTDDINHIWSTQGDVTYRPSIGYEMTLMPVLPKERQSEPPLVGRIGSEVRADIRAATAPFGATISAPPVKRTQVNIDNPGWQPMISFVKDGICANSLVFPLGSTELADFEPRVWVTGAPGAPATLVWQRWTSAAGWQQVAETTPTTATTPILDPEQVATAQTVTLALPQALRDEGGQGVLFAQRSWIRPADAVTLTVRSNPLLITVFGEP